MYLYVVRTSAILYIKETGLCAQMDCRHSIFYYTYTLTFINPNAYCFQTTRHNARSELTPAGVTFINSPVKILLFLPQYYLTLYFNNDILPGGCK